MREFSNVAASSAMICIEERGGKPEQAGPVQPHRRVDPVSAGSFALRFRLGASFARVDRVRGVGRRFDIAVAQVAATYANLLRVHGNATDRRWPAFLAAGTSLAYQDAISPAVQNMQRSTKITTACRTRCIYRPFVAHLVIADVDASVAR